MANSFDYSVIAAEEALAEDTSYFAWIWSIFTLPDEKFLRKCGSDAVQYLRFQRHLIAFVFIMTGRLKSGVMSGTTCKIMPMLTFV